MAEVVQALRSQGVPLCFEQLPIDPRQSRRLADGRIEYLQPTFDIAYRDGPLPAALDAITSAGNHYRWEQVGQRPTYIIYPAGSSALEWLVPAGHGAGQDWIEAITGLPLAEQQISLFPRGLDRQTRFTLVEAPAETVARRWLAAVVDLVGQGRYWNLAGLGAQRTLVIGQVALPESG